VASTHRLYTCRYKQKVYKPQWEATDADKAPVCLLLQSSVFFNRLLDFSTTKDELHFQAYCTRRTLFVQDVTCEMPVLYLSYRELQSSLRTKRASV